MRDESVIRRDIRDEDLNDVLTEFYAIIGVDPLLARYFAEIDMSEHMPKIVAFWSTLLFRTRSYTGNAFRPHMAMPGLTGDHFARWVATLESVVDSLRTVIAKHDTTLSRLGNATGVVVVK